MIVWLYSEYGQLGSFILVTDVMLISLEMH